MCSAVPRFNTCDQVAPPGTISVQRTLDSITASRVHAIRRNLRHCIESPVWSREEETRCRLVPDAKLAVISLERRIWTEFKSTSIQSGASEYRIASGASRGASVAG